MITVLSIAAGGAIGAVSRHFVNVASAGAFGLGFPWGTMIVNIAGSFVMGLLIGLFAQADHVTQDVRAFLTIGFLGAFTTFSTFSLDAVALYERGEMGLSAAYIIGSVVLSIAGLFAGLMLVRGMSA